MRRPFCDVVWNRVQLLRMNELGQRLCHPFIETFSGLGSTVRNNINIGEWSLVGAGSVVVKDIPDKVVAFGNPARVVRHKK